MTRMQIVRNVALCAGLLTAVSVSAQEHKPVAVAKAFTKGVDTGTQGFSIVLVLGDLQGGSTPDAVPPAARKALTDMKDFLPYRGYKLLDTAWVLGSGHAGIRLHGSDDQEYDLSLSTAGPFMDSKTLRVEFQLREAGADSTPAPDAATTKLTASGDLQARRAQLEDELRALQQERGGSVASADAKAKQGKVITQIAELDNRLTRRVGSIINTTFSMDLGETVVVGTSRLKGDKALIALLTAVPRNSSPR